MARLRQARAALGIAAAPLWPAISASAEYQRKHLLPPKAWSVLPQNFYQAGFDAAWELDVSAGSAARRIGLRKCPGLHRRRQLRAGQPHCRSGAQLCSTARISAGNIGGAKEP